VSPFTRYVLFQIPGWLIAALVVIVLIEWVGLPMWGASALLVFWIAKDLVQYRFVRNAYDTNVKTGSERFIGERGIAKEWLRPQGYVQVQGQLWRARTSSEEQPISPESVVRVVDAQGLTLIVTAENDGHTAAAKKSPQS
jgi:membrane protein implicated in regulation of membrane protease activity